MTPAEVYDAACALLGPAAAVVQLGASRWVVGYWRKLGAGEMSETVGGPILRSEVWGLVVEGEGETPALALHVAKRRVIRRARGGVALRAAVAAVPAAVKRKIVEAAPLLGPGER